MMPETWLPTVTFTTGFNVPVAVTTCVKSPRRPSPSDIAARYLRLVEKPNAAANPRDDQKQ